MDKPPIKAKPSDELEDAPEQLDVDVRRAVLRAAETCRGRFDESPSRHSHQLHVILDVLGRYPHLIDPVYRFMDGKDCPSKVPGAAPVVAIGGGVPVRRLVRNKEGEPGYQKIQGRLWEGPSMVNVTRWAIGAYDADPLDVAAAVMEGMPPLLKADGRKYADA